GVDTQYRYYDGPDAQYPTQWYFQRHLGHPSLYTMYRSEPVGLCNTNYYRYQDVYYCYTGGTPTLASNVVVAGGGAAAAGAGRGRGRGGAGHGYRRAAGDDRRRGCPGRGRHRPDRQRLRRAERVGERGPAAAVLLRAQLQLRQRLVPAAAPGLPGAVPRVCVR